MLLGDGTYDFDDVLETGARNHVPPFIVKTPYLWTSSDSAYAAVNGDDTLPDLALGRLPAATLDEARGMVEKIIAYEMGGSDLAGPIVLVADDSDPAGDFPAEVKALSSGVLSGRELTQLVLGDIDASAMRPEITAAFDAGASLVSYMGHGGIHLWADENIFNITDVSALETQPRQPLVLTMNCLNGFFHFPYFDSLAEALLKAEGRGAIAAISPSGLSLHGEAKKFHRAILRELLQTRHLRLGDAWLAAQTDAPSPELLAIYHLFGDPAMKLR